MPRPLIATIDVSALTHNLKVAKSCAPNSKTWAIVKANAYGHGLARAMRGFAASDGLGLVEIDGAAHLREMGWQKPLLLLEGFFDPSDLKFAAQLQLETVIHNQQQIDMLRTTPIAAPLDIYLKLNSGMNRLGFAPDQFRAAYAQLRALPSVRQIRFMTHFANADDAANSALPMAQQMRCFRTATAGLEGEHSLANSAADLLHSDVAADWVRPGVMLYGGSPGGNTAVEFGLLPAMTLTSEVIGIQHINVGDAVGYGSLFIAQQPLTVGVVACGYADGYPRHAPNGTPIMVDGVRTRIIGRVSMDLLTVDLTPIPNAHIGSKVILWGDGLPIDEVAQSAGTIGYELMCALAPRVAIIEIG